MTREANTAIRLTNDRNNLFHSRSGVELTSQFHSKRDRTKVKLGHRPECLAEQSGLHRISAFLNLPSVIGPYVTFKSATMKEGFIKLMGRSKLHP